MLSKLQAAWLTSSIAARAGVVLAVVLAVVIVASFTGGAVSSWKDRRFDQAEQKRQEERAKDLELRQQLIDRAEAAEAQAELLEAQIAVQRELLAKSSKRIQEADRAVEVIVDEMASEIERTGADVPADVRSERIRARLRRLGLLE